MVSDARRRLQGAYAALPRATPDRLPVPQEAVVGIVGTDIPEEPIRAAGLHPLRIVGDPGAATPNADLFVERAVDPLARSIFERLLDGAYGWLSHLVLCHDSDATVRLYYYLRELRRLEPDRRLPELAFVDILHQPARTSAVYTRQRLAGFVETLEGWSGRSIDGEAVRAEIVASNERRRLQRELAELRAEDPARLTGRDALAAIGAASMMTAQEYLACLRGLIDELADPERADGPTGGVTTRGGTEPVRVFLTGSAHDGVGWYEAVEAAGAIIVGEDHANGNAVAIGSIDEQADPLTALTSFYQHRTVSSARTSITRRAEGTATGAVAARADGVLSLLRRQDPAPHWDVAAQRARLEEAGLPMEAIVMDGYRDEPDPAEQEDLAASVARLAQGAGRRSGGRAANDNTEVAR